MLQPGGPEAATNLQSEVQCEQPGEPVARLSWTPAEKRGSAQRVDVTIYSFEEGQFDSSELLPPDQFSFPSGHTITAFAIAVPLSLFYPSLLAGLFFCAISIAVSRILLGMHFLSDVLAGCVLGSALGYTAFRLLT